MMKCLVNLEEYARAIDLYLEVAERQTHNDRTHTMFLKSCVELGDFEKCRSLADWLRKPQNAASCSVELVNALMDYFGKLGDLETAESLMREVLGDKRDTASVNTLMNAFNANGEHDKALALFGETVFADAYSYCIALNACGLGMRLQKGQIIVDELQKSENRDILRHPHVQCALIGFHAKCSQFEEAERLFRENVENYSDAKDVVSLYAAMMDCLAKMGKVDEVLRLFEQLKSEKGAKITNNVRCVVLNACAQTGRTAEAVAIFEEAKATQAIMAPHILNAIIDALARGNQIDDAVRIYREHCEGNGGIFIKFKRSMLLSMLSACRIHSDGVRAEEVTELMAQLEK